jgi:hypothetical protein
MDMAHIQEVPELSSRQIKMPSQYIQHEEHFRGSLYEGASM